MIAFLFGALAGYALAHVPQARLQAIVVRVKGLFSK